MKSNNGLNEETYILSMFSQFKGRLPWVFKWENHEDIHYWYNHTTKTIETDCGTNIEFDHKPQEIDFAVIDDALYSLECKIIEHYKNEFNITLFTPED